MVLRVLQSYTWNFPRKFQGCSSSRDASEVSKGCLSGVSRKLCEFCKEVARMFGRCFIGWGVSILFLLKVSRAFFKDERNTPARRRIIPDREFQSENPGRRERTISKLYIIGHLDSTLICVFPNDP